MMNFRRLSFWASSSCGRNMSLKKCSFSKFVTAFSTVCIVWAVLVLMKSSDVIYNFKQKMTQTVMAPHEGPGMDQDDPTMRYSAVNEQVLVDDYLVQDNPLGTYFNDKLHGDTPVGDHSSASSKLDHKVPLKMVLVFVDNVRSAQIMTLGQFFSQQRIEYRTTEVHAELPPLVLNDVNVPRYILIVFDDYVSYLSMDPSRKAVIDKYCKRYSVGILALTKSTRSAEIELFSDSKLKLQHRMQLKQYKLNPDANIWRIARPESVLHESLPSADWTIFITSHETYTPLATSTVAETWVGTTDDVDRSEFGLLIAVHDTGRLDGIQRIIFGYDIDYWLNSIVAMDAITYLTNGRLGLPIDRLLQVDIDDMFVGKSGIRMLPKDVEDLALSQERIRKFVPGFKYTIGFSGGMYQDGNDEEDRGDQKLIEMRENFVWFDHMYRHEQPHLLNVSRLKLSLAKNIEFAKEHSIDVATDYMVTPHHSGVYPVYEPLYEEWIQDRGVRCTSTEQYPRHLPNWGRRGFIYRGIMAVPRQTCRLFTQNVRFEDYHGGKEELDQSIRGGYLFKLFLQIPVMVFMTHMSNYANDRLSSYTFEAEIEFITTWTRLRIIAPPPLELCRRYFEMYPQEVTPIWTNPCDYNKHLDIWPPGKPCTNLPRLLIVGPQKTGTTALWTFLKAHPKFVTSHQDPTYFEEVQFFSSKSYLNGLDWYLSHFQVNNDPSIITFEKSANYFDSTGTPKRAFALLPYVEIVAILSDPSRRAYSWYQHLRSHNDPVAMNYTFFEIVSAPESAPRFLKDARNRCLKPGRYAVHLARWLQYYSKDQIFLIDADQLTKDPVSVLNRLQKFVKVSPFIDYSTKLRYDVEKGFFCLSESQCLSPGKGRKYVPMDLESARFLKAYFKDDNENLRTLLKDIDKPYPQWLIDES